MSDTNETGKTEFDCERCTNKDICKYVESIDEFKEIDHYICGIFSVHCERYVRDTTEGFLGMISK